MYKSTVSPDGASTHLFSRAQILALPIKASGHPSWKQMTPHSHHQIGKTVKRDEIISSSVNKKKDKDNINFNYMKSEIMKSIPYPIRNLHYNNTSGIYKKKGATISIIRTQQGRPHTPLKRYIQIVQCFYASLYLSENYPSEEDINPFLSSID